MHHRFTANVQLVDAAHRHIVARRKLESVVVPDIQAVAFFFLRCSVVEGESASSSSSSSSNGHTPRPVPQHLPVRFHAACRGLGVLAHLLLAAVHGGAS
jgi:hypothetical protein